MYKKLLSGPFLIWIACGTIIPLGVIGYYGLTNRSGAFTISNITAMFGAEHAEALGLSLLLAGISTIICFLLALSLIHIFNEGIDIPAVNQIVMLRPTESAIIFVQQLGRGLRKYQNKEFVVVVDFIANYRKSFLIPVALSGDRTYNKDTIRRFVREGTRVIPGLSLIHI